MSHERVMDVWGQPTRQPSVRPAVSKPSASLPASPSIELSASNDPFTSLTPGTPVCHDLLLHAVYLTFMLRWQGPHDSQAALMHPGATLSRYTH